MNYSLPITYYSGWNGVSPSLIYNSTEYSIYQEGESNGGPDSFMQLLGDGSSFTLLAGFLNPWINGYTPPDIIGAPAPPTPDCSDGVKNATWPCKGSGAANCTLNPCIRQVHTTMANGNVSETTLDIKLLPSPYQSASTTTLISEEFAIVDRDCANRVNSTLPLGQGNPYNGDSQWLVFVISDFGTSSNMNLTYNDTNGSQNWFLSPPQCTYSVAQSSMYSISQYLQGLLWGNAVPPKGSSVGSAQSSWLPATAFNGSAQINAFYDGGNLTFDSVNGKFAQIAQSMTRAMRINQGKPEFNNPAVGVMMQPETCIVVRWPWIMYPVAMAGLVLVFAVAVIAETGWNDRDHHDWKTSSLPILFNGLEHKLVDGKGGVVSTGAMGELAKSMQVQLGRTAEGWRLRDVRG